MDSDEEYEALKQHLFPGGRMTYVKLRRHPSAKQVRFRELHERRLAKEIATNRAAETHNQKRAERLRKASMMQLRWMRKTHPKGTEFSWVDGKWVVGHGRTHGKNNKNHK